MRRPTGWTSRRARAAAWVLPIVVATACGSADVPMGESATPAPQALTVAAHETSVETVTPATAVLADARSSPQPFAPMPAQTPSTALPRASGVPRPQDSCALPAYPTETCTGVPPGWAPAVTHEGTLTITTDGAVIEDYQVDGDIEVLARDVTIRRTRVYRGVIDNFTTDTVFGHLTLEDVEVTNPPGVTWSDNYDSAIGVADFTCRRCKILYRTEGWRVGGHSYAGQGEVTIEDSYARLSTPPGACETVNPHGDGIQGYDGPHATIRHTTIDQRLDPCPTTALFIPNQDNVGATVTDNLLAGGGWTLTLLGGRFPAVTGNKIVDGEWGYGPLDVDCSLVGTWKDNAVVTVDWERGRIAREVRPLDLCG